MSAPASSISKLASIEAAVRAAVRTKLEGDAEKLLHALFVDNALGASIPRTRVLAVVLAEVMKVWPGVKIAVFSIGKRASTALLTAVIDATDDRDSIVKSDQEQLFINPDPKTKLDIDAASKLYCTPESARMKWFMPPDLVFYNDVCGGSFEHKGTSATTVLTTHTLSNPKR